MALKREPEKPPNHERWLVSYGDLLTLLFAVFVVMYAMGQSDKKKTEEVMQSMQAAFGMASAGSPSAKINVVPASQIHPIPDIKPTFTATAPRRMQTKNGLSKSIANEHDYRQIKSSLEAYLAKEGAGSSVGVKITRRGVIVSLKEAGFFASGSATVKPEALHILETIAAALSSYANMFRVEGHTDNQPIHSRQFRSNWELSSARAHSVLHLLTEAYDIAPEMASAVGYAEYRPIDNNDNAEGRAKNRRVDIVLLATEAEVGEAQPHH